MLTSRPSGDGYNPVINAMGVESFNYSTWHKIFPLCSIAISHVHITGRISHFTAIYLYAAAVVQAHKHSVHYIATNN